MLVKFILIYSTVFSYECIVSQEPCYTPIRKFGTCVNILECPPIFAALTNPKPDRVEYLNKFICPKRDKKTTLCCLSSDGNVHPINSPNNTALSQLSDRTYCGRQHSDDYFRKNDNTTISEFPWLAIIIDVKIEKNEVYKFQLCTGALINARYVLTSTDCLYKHTESNLKVRLGEFNAAKQTEIDCIEIPELETRDCTAYEEFDIEERILHPFRIGFTYNNDIALLRLNRNVLYTDYIRPICLPTPNSKLAQIGDTLYASGWNDQFFVKGQSTKRKIATKVIANDECGRRLRTTITSYNMCTLPFRNNSERLCYLDKGGPVVFSHRNQWHIEGILAEYSGRCDNFSPLILMRVSEYLNWIQDNIRP